MKRAIDFNKIEAEVRYRDNIRRTFRKVLLQEELKSVRRDFASNMLRGDRAAAAMAAVAWQMLVREGALCQE